MVSRLIKIAAFAAAIASAGFLAGVLEEWGSEEYDLLDWFALCLLPVQLGFSFVFFRAEKWWVHVTLSALTLFVALVSSMVLIAWSVDIFGMEVWHFVAYYTIVSLFLITISQRVFEFRRRPR